LEETLDIGGKCYVTARLSGMDNGSSYSAYFRCPIQRIYRDASGELLISSASSSCQNISSPTDPVRVAASNIPSTDDLFADIATGDVIEAMKPVKSKSTSVLSSRVIAPSSEVIQPADAAPSVSNVPAEYASTVPVTDSDRSERLTPVSAPETWITADNYPPAALRAGEAGRVSYSIEVNAEGRPTWCNVTASSGHEMLDKATCRIVQQRARFRPQRERDGHPIPSEYVGSVRWTLPSSGQSNVDVSRPDPTSPPDAIYDSGRVAVRPSNRT
jgi:TonB family protein